MKGLLLRVGIDTSTGGWLSQVDPKTNKFVYVPIPDDIDRLRSGSPTYDMLSEPLNRFSKNAGLENPISVPNWLKGRGCHLDPDFAYLTYGDQANGRGNKISELKEGDFVAFFASMNPVYPIDQPKIYALIGIFFIKNISRAKDISSSDYHKNAHTRRLDFDRNDLIVEAEPSKSGRLDRCIPIGEWRNKSYRAKIDLLDKWGGLEVKDGYLQRSASPPFLSNPERFLSWLNRQKRTLIHENNEGH